MMDGGVNYNPRTVEEVFRDFKGRRAGMIKALTTGLSLSLSHSLLFLPINFSVSSAKLPVPVFNTF